MDASPITEALVLFVAVTAATRFILAPLARAGDGIATLFGPQSSSLGWPRGVQESDEPWAWRTPQLAVVNQPPHPDDHSGDPLSDVSETWLDSPSGRFLVPVAPVEAVQLRVRPH